ncbi:MAG TPA: DUF3237 domain-containing protein [Steroidobacteraceae bacterium]|jgi:hypothetical protein|nr:DUF3237 domain-containing protein [Steroidobacteraceae bacterium]
MNTPALETRFAFTARVSVAEPVTIGNGPDGLRRFVAINGGPVAGPLLNGRVIPGSGDWQVVRPDGVLSADARYTFETHDGVLIACRNRGIRHAPPDVMTKLMRGEPVPLDSYYFRTSAQFEAPLGSPYEWMNRAMFAGKAEREPDKAIIHFFQIL